MAAPRHPLAGPVCLVFWADRGPGASCPYGEGPRRALVTFPRWKVTQGRGGAAPQSYPQARFGVSRRRLLLGRDSAAPRSCGGASQTARLVRKNSQFQPHILFSSRRKENVPLTVQEKRAAGGAVPLWRTPPDPPAERAANRCFSTPHGRTVAPAGGAGLPRLLGRQGSGGFLPFRGGPPARFGDFPAVESHAGVRGRSAPKLSAGTL